MQTDNPLVPPRKVLGNLLSGAKDHRSLDMLLRAVSLAAAHDLPCGRVLSVWGQIKQEFFSEQTVCQLFAYRQKFASARPIPSARKVDRPLNTKAAEAVQQFAKAMSASIMSDSDAAKKAGPRYGSFSPAWRLEDKLASCFDELDPGMAIARYMGAIYPTRSFKQKPTLPPRAGKALQTMVDDVVECADDFSTARKDPLLAASRMVFEGVGREGAALLRAARDLPDVVRGTLFHAAREVDFEFDPSTRHLEREVAELLSHTPVSLCAVPLELAYAFLEVFGYDECEEIGGAISSLVDRFRKAFESSVPVASPLSLQDCWRLRFLAQNFVPTETLHSALLLSDVNLMSDHDYSRDLITVHRAPDLLHNNYLKLIAAARADDLTGLSDSVVAFYLFFRTVHSPYTMGEWKELRPLVDEAYIGPHAEGVRRAVQYCEEEAESRGDKIFAQVVSRSHVGGAKLAAPRPEGALLRMVLVARSSRDEAASALERLLGTERWHRLLPTTRDALIDADVKWARVQGDLLKVQESWADIAIVHIVPFERELASRLNSVLSSDLGREYLVSNGLKAREMPDLGLMLGVLRRFDSLSPKLKEAIVAAGVNLQLDRSALKQLDRLRQIRNEAGHGSPISGVRVAEVKSLMYEMGLLAAFADSMEPLSKPEL